MAVETVLLALLGVVAAWLVVDAGRERHRLRARMERAGARSARTSRASGSSGGVHPVRRVDAHDRSADPRGATSPSEPWRYWPLTVATSEDGSIGPRL
jgi:hypothetical protein